MITGLDLIQAYRKKLESDDANERYAALGFAFQLPGICARLEFPLTPENIKLGLYRPYKDSPTGYQPCDRQMFIRWFKMHAQSFVTMHSAYMNIGEAAKDLYSFRDSITHEGVVLGHSGRVVLIDDKCGAGMVTGRFLFMTVYEFCNMVFDVAEHCFEQFFWTDEKVVEFSSFSGCGLDKNFYESLRRFVTQKFRKFWDARTHEDNMLNMLYDLAFFDGSPTWSQAKAYFLSNPDGVYEIEQFDRKYSIVLPDNVVFFEKEYPVFPGWRNGDMYKGTVCRLTKQQFERMVSVHKELDKYGRAVDDVVAEALKTGNLSVFEGVGDGNG